MVMEFISGQTQVFTKETGNKTKYLVTVNTLGMTEEHSKDIGTITTCMAKVSILGLTVESMKENT